MIIGAIIYLVVMTFIIAALAAAAVLPRIEEDCEWKKYKK
jgi:hypothetical protein